MVVEPKSEGVNDTPLKPQTIFLTNHGKNEIIGKKLSIRIIFI